MQTNIDSYYFNTASLYYEERSLKHLRFSEDFQKAVPEEEFGGRGRFDKKLTLKTGDMKRWEIISQAVDRKKFSEDIILGFAKKEEWVNIGATEVEEYLERPEDLVLVRLTFSTDKIVCQASSGDLKKLIFIRDFLLETFDSLIPKEKKLSIASWTNSNGFVDYSFKAYETITWKSIRQNYAGSVRDGMDRMVSWDHWPEGGKLCLWHGQPGTGKTHAIQALAEAWQDWAVFHNIIEPEKLFSSDSSYLSEVINTISEGLEYDSDKKLNDYHHVLILEDTGELLSADAKERVGPGLSKFLNLIDGLLGRGINLSVIVTTNEPLEKLHAAVERPGRCLVNILFPALSESEAEAWLKKNGVKKELPKVLTLANLYSLTHDETIGISDLPVNRSVGFAF